MRTQPVWLVCGLLLFACELNRDPLTVDPTDHDASLGGNGGGGNGGRSGNGGGGNGGNGDSGSGGSGNGGSGSGGTGGECGCDPRVDCSIGEDGEPVCDPCPTGYYDPAEDPEDPAQRGRLCLDIDECAENRHDCDRDPQAMCMNTVGGHVCLCPPGYDDPMGHDCEEVDECALGRDECDDDPPATCTNLPGRYACNCPFGYDDPVSGGRNCVDINECALGLFNCGDATCSNTVGGYDCVCSDGYEAPPAGGPCVDIDECAEGTDDCDDAPDACVNTDGGYDCVCPTGYADPDGQDCQDVNECTLNTDDCDTSPAATCMNTTGSFTCMCPVGYADATTHGANCVDANECVLDTDTCSDTPDACVNTTGSFMCACPTGYNDSSGGAGTSCTDRNECTLGTDLCDNSPAATCNNIPGSYTCTCPVGTWDALGNGSRCEPLSGRIAVGNSHTCVIRDGGGVRCIGYNAYGQLGRGVGFWDPSETLAGVNDIDLGGQAVQITTGGYHTCVVLSDGRVKCWGANDFGQLGLGDTDNRGDNAGEMGAALPAVNLGTGRTALEVGAGYEYTCARLDNGSVKCWGSGEYGQHGQGDSNDPSCINHTLPRHPDCARGDEPNEMGDALLPIDLTATAVALSPGYRFVCALLSDQRVKCWARNANGYLGIGDTEHRGNDPGELGTALPAVDFGTGRHAVQLSSGTVHTCAVLDNGSVKCWGSDMFGGLGQALAGSSNPNLGDQPGEMGDALPTLPIGAAVRSLASGNHSCAILQSGAMKCWGDNQYGQLGLGDVNTRGDNPGEIAALPNVNLGTGRTPLWLVGDELHSCAILDNGNVKCWGRNTSGQLGTGDTDARGDNPGEMGDALPSTIDLF